MNGLSLDVNLTPFIGRELVQLGLGAWSVAFVFDGPVRIVVESSIVIASADGKSNTVHDFRQGATELCSLIGLKVVGAERSSAGGMTLHLSSGARVEIENSNVGYESFQVHLGDRIVVA